jgi:hypothetical protein
MLIILNMHVTITYSTHFVQQIFFLILAIHSTFQNHLYIILYFNYSFSLFYLNIILKDLFIIGLFFLFIYFFFIERREF